jgi:N-formylglutamate amidohydrolase
LLDFPVTSRVQGKVHRYFCDPARDPEDAGPDGAFRELDREGKPVFLKPLSREERAEAFLAFHESFHEELREARQDEDLVFHFQCSVMEGEGPEVCLGNHGGPDGGPLGGSFTSCPKEDLIRLSRLFEEHDFQVQMNNPFAGGYDVLLHGKRWYAGLERLPVVALGLNENLWLTEPMGIYDPDKGHPVKERLRRVLDQFAEYLLQDEVRL